MGVAVGRHLVWQAANGPQTVREYDGGLGGGAPAAVEWTDDLGFGWWGDVPAGGWAGAVTGARLDTIR